MRFRLPIIFIFLSACVAAVVRPAHGQTVPVAWPDKTHLIGIVTDVVGPAGDPTSFGLQLGTMSAGINTISRTRFVARSLEAQVEKFVSGDYALVTVRRTRTGLVAARITYDVAPFPPLRELSGLIQWVSPDQTRIRLRVDSGNKIVPIRVRPQARYHLDGRITDTIPTLVRGQELQVLALQHNGLDGYEIDVVRGGYTITRGGQ